MNVQTGRSSTAVTSKERNVIESDSGSFQHGTALMPQGVRSQRRQPDTVTNLLHDLIKGADGQGTAGIARGVCQENGASLLATICCNECSTVALDVATNQVQDTCGDWDISHASSHRRCPAPGSWLHPRRPSRDPQITRLNSSHQ